MPIYVSSAAAEAASGSMSMGNIRMSNINMNKYDAAQTMNAGTSTKMSMDYQQTASNQSSVRTGTENIHSDKDQIMHEGSTWIQGPNGQQYELNGTFKQTAAGWEASGTFIDQNGKSWSGTMTGTAKNMEAFQNNVKNGDEAVLQAISIDTSNLSRSHERHQDNISTANDVDQANRTFERKDTVNVGNSGSMSGDNIMVNGESVSGKVSWNGDTATIEGTKDGMKYTATVENASIGFGKNGMSVTGDIVKSNKEGGNSTNIDNTYSDDSSTNVVTGVKEDHSNTYSSGTKTSVGDTVNDYTGGLALLQGGLSNFGANQGLMKEAFVDNMTKYQNSIMSEQGKNQLSLDKAFGIAGDASGSAGFKILGTGVQASVSAELSAIAKEGSGQVSSADLNRVMNSAILEQLDIDAKNNNWTAEQYDQAARERFGAYNNYLKEQAGQSFGPSDEDLAPIKKAEELGQKTEQVVNKLLK